MNPFELRAAANRAEKKPETEAELNERMEKQKLIIMEKAVERRGNLAKDILTSEVVNNGLDILPFAGSGKMIVEAAYGGTLSGKEISGKDRIIHGAIGAGMLALDFTGIGEAGRLLELSGKALPLVERIGAKLAEKGVVKGAAIFAKTSEFMARHPELVARAEKMAETKIRQHLARLK